LNKSFANVRSNQAYYNAGSAALILVLIFIGIGVFLWCRVRRNRVRLPQTKASEEAIPLTSHNGQADDDEAPDAYPPRDSAKGKAKAVGSGYPEEDAEPMFNVGDSDDEEGSYGRS